MAEMCIITTCKRKSIAICHCCKENLCLHHLKEHQDLLISQLNPLADRINILGVRFKAFDVNRAVDDCRQKLSKWRDACHKMIENLYEEKNQELDQRVTNKMERQRDDISHIQSRVVEMIREEEVTRPDIVFLTTAICDLEKEMKNIEEVFFTVETRPLTIDDSFIRMIGSHVNELDLSTFSLPHKTIDCPKECSALLASNDWFLLIHKESSLCLIDQNLTVVKQNAWNHGKIYSICWSAALYQFIVNSNGNIFLVNGNTLTVEEIQFRQNLKWGSCTCSDTKLYITIWEIGSTIIEFDFTSSSIKCVKQWQSPITCSEQEIIHDISYNNNTLALVIKDKTIVVWHEVQGERLLV